MNFEFVEIILDYKWVIDYLVVIFLMWLINFLFGQDIKSFFSFLFQEIKEFSRLNFSLGTINILLLLILGIFGFVLILDSPLKVISNFVAKQAGSAQASDLINSARPIVLFFLLYFFATLSFWLLGKKE